MSGEELRSQAARQAAGRLYCGVDIGASATKLVLIDETRRAARSGGAPLRHRLPGDRPRVPRRGPGRARSWHRSDLAATVSTGYGRHNVDLRRPRTATEIHCHGLGCFHHFPRAISIVDIGGQDNKVIHLEADGRRSASR